MTHFLLSQLACWSRLPPTVIVVVVVVVIITPLSRCVVLLCFRPVLQAISAELVESDWDYAAVITGQLGESCINSRDALAKATVS